MSDEEKEKLEQEFQYALDNIVSKIKGETATAIVVSEQSMILLFKKLMLKIEKQQKEIEDLKEKIKNFTIEDENIYLQFGEITEKKRWQDKIKEKIKWYEDFRGSILYEKYNYEEFVKDLQSLLEKEKNHENISCKIKK